MYVDKTGVDIKAFAVVTLGLNFTYKCDFSRYDTDIGYFSVKSDVF